MFVILTAFCSADLQYRTECVPNPNYGLYSDQCQDVCSCVGYEVVLQAVVPDPPTYTLPVRRFRGKNRYPVNRNNNNNGYNLGLLALISGLSNSGGGGSTSPPPPPPPPPPDGPY